MILAFQFSLQHLCFKGLNVFNSFLILRPVLFLISVWLYFLTPSLLSHLLIQQQPVEYGACSSSNGASWQCLALSANRNVLRLYDFVLLYGDVLSCLHVYFLPLSLIHVLKHPCRQCSTHKKVRETGKHIESFIIKLRECRRRDHSIQYSMPHTSVLSLIPFLIITKATVWK